MKVIWSIEHKAWWRPNSQGYTNNLATAGLYEQDEADEIVKASNGENETAVSLEKAFAALQKQAFEADMSLNRLRNKAHEMDALIRETKVLERT